MKKKTKVLIIIWIIPIVLFIFSLLLLFTTGKIAGVLIGAVMLYLTGVVSLIALIISLIYIFRKRRKK